MSSACYILGIVAYSMMIVYYAIVLGERFVVWLRRRTNKQAQG
jgi:hypothetical protein